MQSLYEEFHQQAVQKNRTNYSKDISNLIRESYGGKLKVYKTDIPRSVRAEEISAEGHSIFQHDPKEKVADAYRVLTKEVLNNAEKLAISRLSAMPQLPRAIVFVRSIDTDALDAICKEHQERLPRKFRTPWPSMRMARW